MPEPVAQWLWHRGIHTVKDWHDLTAEPSLSSPYLLPDMQRDVDILENALRQQWKIRIHGDYDADGVTATAVMLIGLKALDPSGVVDFHIPNRFDEGYGLSTDAVRQAAEDDVQLLVTVDCGASSQEAATLARQLGLTLIITDHHGLSTPLPTAAAIVNPERMQTPNRFSGAGVALQLIRALTERTGRLVGDQLLAIAAIGTVADVVPLIGDNRSLVKLGLAALRSGVLVGASALVERSHRSLSHLQASDLAFYLGPRLNAAGRMADAAPAVEILTTTDPARANTLADQLDQANLRRRELERELVEQAWLQLQEWRQSGRSLTPFVVVGGDGWHHGVIGIVASRLKEVLRSPVAVVGWDGDEGKGSARSVDGLNLLGHLRRTDDAFLKLGGHRGAAGFSLKRQSLTELAQRLSERLPPEVMRYRYRGPVVDGRYGAEELSTEVAEWVDRLQPTGHGFEAPRWLIRGKIDDMRLMGAQGDHVRYHFEGTTWTGLAFHAGSKASWMAPGNVIWTVGELHWDVYRDRRQLRFRSDQLLTPPMAAPWAPGLRLSSPPTRLTGPMVLIVDSQLELKQLAQQGIDCYDWTHPAAERALLSRRVASGEVDRLAFCQWRPWPEWQAVADHVIWLCHPLSIEGLGFAASLLRTSGTQWLDPIRLNAPSRGRLLSKWQRLVPERDALARLWRLLASGHTPLWAGRGVFQELGLDPSAKSRTDHRRLMDSPSYRQGWALRTSIESENLLEAIMRTQGRLGSEHGMDAIDSGHT